jgi:hypothetical protein
MNVVQASPSPSGQSRPPIRPLQVSVFTRLDPAERADWEGFLATATHQHPRQDPRFALAEAADGRPTCFTIGRDEAGRVAAVGLWTLRPHTFILGAYSEASCLSGPVVDEPDTMLAFLEAVRSTPAFARVGRLRVTPFWTDADADALTARLAADGWKRSEPDPFRQTGWVDLTPGPDGILAAFSKSARREYRRAQRQGITISPASTDAEAEEFLESLNRLRRSRGLTGIPAPGFRAAFHDMHRHGRIGIILTARHEGRFIGGLQLYRGRHAAHGRHFTTEPEILRALSNLRIAPLIWHHGMIWAHDHGCKLLDVEGWQHDTKVGDSKFNIYKYKAEFGPEPVRRIAEHVRSGSVLIGATGNVAGDLQQGLRRLRRRFR